MLDAFHGAVLVCAALLVVGAVLSALLVRPDALAPSVDEAHAAPEAPCRRHCSVNAPPLQPNERPHEQPNERPAA
jgi:hypothetical protein